MGVAELHRPPIAAQERNIEVGLLVRSRPLADRLVLHFETLLAQGLLWPLPSCP